MANYGENTEIQAERERCVNLAKQTHAYLNGLIERAPETDKPGLFRARVMLLGLAYGIAGGAVERMTVDG